MPSISISVPIGAYHELFPDCLASLANQSGDIRVSLLDASGDDRVRALADKYGDLFAYRRHGPDAGQSDAIIEGWSRAPGDILGWLNADDRLYPHALELVQAKFDEDPSIDVVFGHSAVCDQRGGITGYHWAVTPDCEALRTGCTISQPSCFFKRSASEAVGGLDRSLHYTMDWDLWLRLLDSGAGFSFLDAPLSVVYWGEGTKTQGLGEGRRSELERIISRYAPPGKRMRVRRGFALRAMLDAIGSPQAKWAIEAALRRHSPSVFGIGPNGRLDARATLYLAHYCERARRSLKLTFENAGAIEARSDFEISSIDRRVNGMTLVFREPAPPGRTISISLAVIGGAKARLINCEFE